MCYSEELKREAGGFLVGDQWVLTGWKGMYVENATVRPVRIPHYTPQYRFVLSQATNFEWSKVEIEPQVTYTESQAIVPEKGKTPRFYSMYAPSYTYEFGKVMTDGHGFHLAATLDGAKNALTYGAGMPPAKNMAFTKILALESAIEDNHAHVVVILEPGKEPTQEQIEAIANTKYQKYVGKRDAMYTTMTSGSYIGTSTSATYTVPVSSASMGWVNVNGTSALTAADMQKLYGQVTLGAAKPSIWGDSVLDLES